MEHLPTLEQRIVGTMIRHNSTIDIAINNLRPSSVQSETNGVVFQAIIDLNQSGSPVDLVLLAQRLGVDNIIRRVGGYQVLALLWDSACTETEFPGLIEELRKQTDEKC
jgi:replicative DNA helicase